MAKRSAASELNRDNWDDEEVPEDQGNYCIAPQDELNKRVIKRARRRNIGSDSEPSGAFMGFSGFSSGETTKMSTFSFMPSKASVNGSSSTLTTAKSVTSMETINPTKSITLLETINTTKSMTSMESLNSGDTDDTSLKNKTLSRSPEFYKSLNTLNNNVLSWISLHVKKNPYCILSPVFADYKKHLEELEKAFPNVPVNEKPVPKAVSCSKVESLLENVTTGSPPALPKFSFGSSLTARDDKPKNVGFTFGAVSQIPKNVSSEKFSFATAAPVNTANQESKPDDEQEHYEPPKPDVTNVVEDDAFYSIRCKLFAKKGDSYVDRGIGMLHLKPTSENKTQLLIRASTKLGTILLNIILNSDIKIQLNGNNNVLLVCVPNPPLEYNKLDGPVQPVPMLIRVKTGDEAKELLAQMKKHAS